MRTKSQTIWATSAFTLLVGAMLVMQTRSVGAATGDSLEQRVTALEKLVIHNPDKPEAAIGDRLDLIEHSLKIENNPEDLKTIGDLKEALIRSDVRQQALAQKLAALEARSGGSRATTDDKPVAELRKDIQAQDREVRDLTGRVRRIESRGGFGGTGY